MNEFNEQGPVNVEGILRMLESGRMIPLRVQCQFKNSSLPRLAPVSSPEVVFFTKENPAIILSIPDNIVIEYRMAVMALKNVPIQFIVLLHKIHLLEGAIIYDNWINFYNDPDNPESPYNGKSIVNQLQYQPNLLYVFMDKGRKLKQCSIENGLKDDFKAAYNRISQYPPWSHDNYVMAFSRLAAQYKNTINLWSSLDKIKAKENEPNINI